LLEDVGEFGVVRSHVQSLIAGIAFR
jgi:hypothetical protein